MSNQELADIFNRIADLLELQGVSFKPAAYRKAARSLEGLSEDIAKIAKRGGLGEIPGVGEAIASKIEEYLKTGKVAHLEELRKKIPGQLDTLLDVQGVGPKKAVRLYKELKIDSIPALKTAAQEGKIRSLAGFGLRSEEEILKGIALLEGSTGRMLLGPALAEARRIIAELDLSHLAQNLEICGSLRRRKETIGDIDLLATSKKPVELMAAFAGLGVRTLAKGETKSSILLGSGLQVDLRVVDEQSLGAALQYFTGSKEHNIALRNIAIKKGFKLNEYGLYGKESGKLVAGKSEKEIYAKLGMAYVEPEMRENSGEIELAQKRKLPRLIPYGCMRGDMHVHTTFSDGKATVREMAQSAKARGYEYIAITDHSQSQTIAGGMGEAKLRSYLAEIEKVRKEIKGIRIFAGAEVDILRDGALDYPDSLLRELDIVTISVHASFKMPSEQMTRRLIAAVSHPLVDVFNHPTGRRIGSREPYDFDFEAVVRAAVKNGVHFEINSLSERLDLKPELIREAKRLGAKFTISTDAHSVDGLQAMELGISQARRGWLEAKDVVNTRPLRELPRFFKQM